MSRVFISYSHDSTEHRETVLRLSERLRKDGIETILDQYVNGAPEQGWPRWMLDQLDAADSVLVVCTETYYRRFRGHEEPGKGKGANWEGALITQELYDSRSRTLKFVPVFLSAAVLDWIPEPLRSGNFYALTSEAEYQRLYDYLLKQAGVEPHPVGTLKARPRRKGTPLTFGEAAATVITAKNIQDNRGANIGTQSNVFDGPSSSLDSQNHLGDIHNDNRKNWQKLSESFGLCIQVADLKSPNSGIRGT